MVGDYLTLAEIIPAELVKDPVFFFLTNVTQILQVLCYYFHFGFYDVIYNCWSLHKMKY